MNEALQPVILVIDDLHDAFNALINNVKKYADGKLYTEFEFVYLDSYQNLEEWYRKNPGRFVSLIIQDVDFTHTRSPQKLLRVTDLWKSPPKSFDERALQGFLIYGLLRTKPIDRFVPVLFVSSRIGLDTTRDFAEYLVYPGYGSCSFAPDYEMAESFYIRIATLIDSLGLRPIKTQQKEEWHKYYSMIIGRSRLMCYLLYDIERIAPTEATVIIMGGPGVGKELAANAIHKKSYRYDPELKDKGKPLTVNIAALDRNLIEDELFGHEKGAFTGATGMRDGIFEAAAGSTVFLDEIGDLSKEVQIKLLRTMEYKTIKRLGSSHEIEVDFRVLCATNRTIENLQKCLRPDFYARLIQHCLLVPGMREKWVGESYEVVENDIWEFCDFFVEKMNNDPRIMGKIGLSNGVVKFLSKLAWEYVEGGNELFAGNVRTLRNLVERAYERCQYEGQKEISLGHIISTLGMMRLLERPPVIPQAKIQELNIESVVGSLNLVEVEKKAILEALAKTGHNQTQAAELLNMHRDTLRKKIQEYGI
ncbi:MAG: sigma 54-interacting transcriptional regulator [candidate division WOR-3 bacterium]|nr:sigma 54-interacting transcriptional regulator [candidate division WOR-3 bacterium]